MFENILSEVLPLVITISLSAVIPVLIVLLFRLMKKAGIELTDKERSLIMKEAKTAVLSTEEKIASKIREITKISKIDIEKGKVVLRQVEKEISSDAKKNDAIHSLMTNVKKITYNDAAKHINAALASIPGTGATKKSVYIVD